jgi:PAS domain S-box-containing protein
MSTKRRKQLSWVLLVVALGVIVWQGTVTYQNQRRLEEAEQRLELALWGSDNGLFDVTVPHDHKSWDAAYAWYSSHFMELLGIDHHAPPLPPYGASFLDRVRAEDRKLVTGAIETAVRTKNGFDVIFQAKHMDGMYHWYTLRGRYSMNGHERVSGTLLDITPQMLERQRADLIILSAPDAVIACGNDRKITLFNPAAAAMFGVEAATMIGEPIDKIVTEEYLEQHDRVFATAVEKLRAQPGNWMVRRDAIEGEGRNIITGEVFPVLLAVRGIKYRGEMEFIATIQRAGEEAPDESMPLPSPVQMLRVERRPMREH